VTLLDLGWVKLIAYCSSQLIVGLSHPGAEPIEVGSLQRGLYYTDVNGAGVSWFGIQGGIDMLQVGQKYQLVGGGFPRTRMVTLVISGTGDAGVGCRVQIQALAQGY
jgi:hypothetical protein